MRKKINKESKEFWKTIEKCNKGHKSLLWDLCEYIYNFRQDNSNILVHFNSGDPIKKQQLFKLISILFKVDFDNLTKIYDCYCKLKDFKFVYEECICPEVAICIHDRLYGSEFFNKNSFRSLMNHKLINGELVKNTLDYKLVEELPFDDGEFLRQEFTKYDVTVKGAQALRCWNSKEFINKFIEDLTKSIKDSKRKKEFIEEINKLKTEGAYDNSIKKQELNSDISKGTDISPPEIEKQSDTDKRKDNSGSKCNRKVPRVKSDQFTEEPIVICGK
jgi:hypothetical protein